MNSLPSKPGNHLFILTIVVGLLVIALTSKQSIAWGSLDTAESRAFEEALLYYDLGNFQSALHTFENLIKEYPDSDKLQNIRFLAVKSAFLLAENSIYEKKMERYELTLKKYDEFRRKYPISEYDPELEDIQAKSLIEIKKLKNV